MKKIAILGLPVLAAISLTACNADTEPRLDTSTDFEFKLNTPPLANQFINLADGGNIDFTVSQPNYGLTVAPTYGLEISLKEDFTPITTEPVVDSKGEEHVVPGTYTLTLESALYGVLTTSAANIAAGINDLNGIYDEESYTEDYEGPVYVRATAYLGYGLAAEKTAVVSNVVKLAKVRGYGEFPSDAFILSVPGGANNWSHLPQIIYTSDSETGAMICRGFAVIDGEFKITDGDWDGAGNWGADADGLKANADGSFEGSLIQNSQSNFNGDKAAEAGLYYFYVELTDKDNATQDAVVGTFKMIPITKIALPGDYNGWSTTDNYLSTDGDYGTWTVSAPFTAAGWKFAMNDSWDINLGGTSDELTFDGPNCVEAGSKVTLHIGQYPWTYTVE